MYFIWKFDCKGRKDVPPDQATINNENLVFSTGGIKANACATDAGSSASSPKRQGSSHAQIPPFKPDHSMGFTTGSEERLAPAVDCWERTEA